MLALGVFFLFTGLNQLRRSAEMENQAYRAEAALAEGDYTAATRYALMSTERGALDPPVIPEARAILAETVSAYDYAPGYQPARSVALAGRALQARFSAGGRWIAALADDASEMRDSRRIYSHSESE